MLKTDPAVFAVGDTYQIMAPVENSSLMWVRIGEKCYYDESNGIMRSFSKIHKITVPMDELDAAKCYTVCEREIIDRKPYFPETKDVAEKTFIFRPVGTSQIRAYHIADAHNMTVEPIKAAEAFGEIDFLILNGDIVNHSGDLQNFETIFQIAAGITHGNIPVVFSRGNHDMRGIYAERLTDYMPGDRGNSYYTFRLGGIWGIILDCGEDKDDSHPEYGHTICCHGFREKQRKYIKSVIHNAKEEYLQEGVSHKIVVVHNPFTKMHPEPFGIEKEIYLEWSELLKDFIKPDVMICGHLHYTAVFKPGCEQDDLGQPCTVVIGSAPGKGYFAGTGFLFEKDGIEITFTDSEGKILGRQGI